MRRQERRMRTFFLFPHRTFLIPFSNFLFLLIFLLIFFTVFSFLFIVFFIIITLVDVHIKIKPLCLMILKITYPMYIKKILHTLISFSVVLQYQSYHLHPIKKHVRSYHFYCRNMTSSISFSKEGFHCSTSL